MKSIIFLALVAIAAAAPVDKEPPTIVKSALVQEPQGPYNLSFETSDGISRSEIGELKEVLDEEGKPRTVVVVKGTYSYPNEFGVLETIDYIADENGFRAEGPSIPKEPVPARR
ncbi:larval cuticle protein 1 [Bicyclus anynana]|uniref:Larval cuticle protein 1 n=1 Tax=Bicyclus anynana TaxID=110368 RepID=A0A6J1P867_BICAN|nr:larval cuticle protein 1 [Bicyclus anynana]